MEINRYVQHDHELEIAFSNVVTGKIEEDLDCGNTSLNDEHLMVSYDPKDLVFYVESQYVKFPNGCKPELTLWEKITRYFKESSYTEVTLNRAQAISLYDYLHDCLYVVNAKEYSD